MLRRSRFPFLALLAALALGAFLPSLAQAATLTVQTAKASGLAPTFAAASVGGDKCINDGRTIVLVKNSSGANAYTVTAVTPMTVGGIAVADVAAAVATSASPAVLGPFPIQIFNDGSRMVSLTYTGTAPATDLTVACVSVPFVQ